MKLVIKIKNNSPFSSCPGDINELSLSIDNGLMCFDLTEFGEFLFDRNLASNLMCEIISKDFVNDDGSELTEEQINEIGEERMNSVAWAVIGYYRGFRDMAMRSLK